MKPQKSLKDLTLLERFLFDETMEDTIYDAEPQNKNTHNLPKRSRYYQGMIDAKLLKPGEVDFNKLNQVFIILITPFDLFGYNRYVYTFRMTCEASGVTVEAYEIAQKILETEEKE